MEKEEVVKVNNNMGYVTADQIGAIARAQDRAAFQFAYTVQSPMERWCRTVVVFASVAMLLYILLFLDLLLGSMTASTFLGPTACCVLLVVASGFWFVAFLLMLCLR
ncbi:hypothetical protein CRD59_00820 [Bifidobacterium xylocopae]|uniref:Uncharacterized protein n=1 Tax=Bifidobacterium xylocopae TaxID=2493119 RepID=A0A366KE95_9BIFI|nr:hypothetical protein CRD59_00820 [Bifidobacterium xylocopae]